MFEGYHEELLAATQEAIRRGVLLSEQEKNDADISLEGYLCWCAEQPTTPSETWRAMQAGNVALDSELSLPGDAMSLSTEALALCEMSRSEPR